MRLTIDLDRCSRSKLENHLTLLRMLFPGRKIEYRRSASGRGYHIVVHNAGSEEEVMRFRKFLGDDPLRLHIDRFRGNCGCETQVLFTLKKEGRAGEWKT